MKKENKNGSGFGQWCLGFLKRNYIYIIMILLVALRVGLGYAIGAWYGTNQTCDELAMFDGLSVRRIIEPNELSLIKDLNFSLFLGFSAITNLPYTIVISLFWALTAFCMWLLVRKVVKNKWVQFFSFVYVLFIPTAFEAWGGLRIYRNAIIVPCIILTFSLALLLLVDLVKKEKIKKTIWIAICTGLAFAFTCYLQEDGIWLKACMAVILLISLIIIGYRLFSKKKYAIKKAVIWVAVVLIPFGVVFLWENVYKGINYAAFGVYETNTRTEGELAEYVKTTYIVESPNRSKTVWSPYDAIAATFEASPTLKSHPELLERIRTSPWVGGDMEKESLPREFFGWAVRTALKDAGLWTSEVDVANMFKQVNLELSEAFSNGTLKKASGRIQILSSAGAYTWGEIFDGELAKNIWMSFRDAIWMEGYTIGHQYSSDESNNKIDNKILHMVGDVNSPTGEKREIGKIGANVVVWIYRVVNTALVVSGIVFIVVQFAKLIRNWKIRKKYIKENKLSLSLALTSFMFFGVTLAYSFGILWFFTEDFNRQVFIFYYIGMTGLITFAYIAALMGWVEVWRKRKEHER